MDLNSKSANDATDAMIIKGETGSTNANEDVEYVRMNNVKRILISDEPDKTYEDTHKLLLIFGFFTIVTWWASAFFVPAKNAEAGRYRSISRIMTDISAVLIIIAISVICVIFVACIRVPK